MNIDRSRGGGGAIPLLVLLAAAVPAGCGGVDDGLVKFPVRGTVLVDGEPAEGVLVRCFRDGRPGDTNADTPVGVTDAEGRFQLATNGERDGAVAGTYTVTFFWPDFNGPGGRDRLDGTAGSPSTSPFEITVAEGDNELPPFELASKAGAATGAERGRPRPDGNDRPR